MQGSKRLREKASRYAKTAVKLERENKIKEAAVYYFRAIKTLSKMSDLEMNVPPNLKEIYQERIKSYKKRIKDILSSMKGKEEKKGRKKREEEELVEGVIVKKTEVNWGDIGNLKKAKKTLKEACVWPIKKPEIFQGVRRPWRGILLFGPPGCGKTLLAKAVANEADATFFNVDSATILSKWLGESEKLVKKLFEQARESEVAIIYIDEVEAVAGERRTTEHGAMNRVKTVFLSQMDGLNSSEENIIVIGSTNLPQEIDLAFRRRFEKRIFVPPPDKKARKEILKIYLRQTEYSTSINLEELAKRTKGFSGHDLELLVREAAMNPVRELASEKRLFKDDVKVRKVKMSDFEKVLQGRKPSLSEEEKERYRKWAEKFAN